MGHIIVYEEQVFWQNRADAGRRLADNLAQYQPGEVIVLAIPRGGVSVGMEIAERLGAPLDLVVSHKIPIPHNPEAGYGAVAEEGTIVLNEPLVRGLALTEHQIRRQAEEVQAEIARRSSVYRCHLPASSTKGKIAIIVDDGLASGFTMLAAIKSMERRKAARTVAAVPVASRSAYDLVKPLADELVCLVVARVYQFAVASFYYGWHDPTDEEIIKHLDDWRTKHPSNAL